MHMVYTIINIFEEHSHTLLRMVRLRIRSVLPRIYYERLCVCSSFLSLLHNNVEIYMYYLEFFL